MPTPVVKKADFRKQVKKKALGEKIMICENCLKEGRRSVFQGWNSSQHVKAKKNMGCTTDRKVLKDSFCFSVFKIFKFEF